MRKKLKFLLLAFVWLTLGSSYAQERAFNQKKAPQVHHLGLSLPMIWNNSSAVFYQIGRKEPEGSALSYGINLSYSKSIHRNIFGTLGIGYFKQVFGIRRPIYYFMPNIPDILIFSESYAYHSFHFLAGLGYQQSLGEKFTLKGQVTYNTYRSFRQRYTPVTTVFGGNQVNKNSLNIGRMANLQLDLERRLSNKLSLGMGLIIPVWVEWKNEKMFYELGYADDENKIAYDKFSIGTHFFCNYHF